MSPESHIFQSSDISAVGPWLLFPDYMHNLSQLLVIVCQMSDTTLPVFSGKMIVSEDNVFNFIYILSCCSAVHWKLLCLVSAALWLMGIALPVLEGILGIQFVH